MISCRFGFPVLPPPVDKPKARPAMTWAEMAAREGHRKGLPPTPPPTGPGAIPPRDRRLLAALLARGPIPRGAAYGAASLGYADGQYCLHSLMAAGFVVETPAPIKCHPRRTVLTVTPAGRSALETP